MTQPKHTPSWIEEITKSKRLTPSQRKAWNRKVEKATKKGRKKR